MIQKLLSYLSSNAEIFNEIKSPYENMLKNNGFKCKLSYETNDNKVKRVINLATIVYCGKTHHIVRILI